MAANKLYLTSCTSVLAACLLAVPALAQDQAAPEQPTAGAVADTTPPAEVAPPPPTASAEEEQLGEIVVTAQRRSESLQRVPVAISAVNAQQILEARIEDADDLVRISPGVQVTMSMGNTQINIRGLGLEQTNPAGEPSVLTYVDGVYMARTTSIGAAFDDLDRIEILRGPQGTLYGRNATGGVVNLITRTPGDEFAGNVSATYGRYNRIKLTGGVEGPLTENTSARIAFSHDSNDGDINNITTGESLNDLSMNAVRGTIVSDLSETVQLTVRGDYYKDKLGYYQDLINGTTSTTANPFGSNPNDPNGFFDAVNLGPGAPPLPNDGRNIANDATDPHIGRRNYGFSATLDFELSDSVALKSITAYRDAYHKRRRIDQDGAPSRTFRENYADEYSDSWSQEFDLTGETEGGSNWVVGAYYFEEKLDLDYLYNYYTLPRIIEFVTPLPPGVVPDTYTFEATGKTRSLSGFAQVTAPLTDQLKVTAGIRKNFDKKKLSQQVVIFGADQCGGFATVKDDWNDLTWKLGLDYQVTDRSLVYGLVSKGFKAGGLNISGCGSSFDPENVINYEIGTKNTFLDGALLINAGAFYYDYTDLQVNIYTQTTNETRNSSGSRVYGAEFEMRARPSRQLEIGGNLSYLFAEYRNFTSVNPLTQTTGVPLDMDGFNIAHAPKWNIAGNVDYSIPVGDNELKLRYDVRYTSHWWGDNFHNPGTFQDNYTLHNARAAFSFGDYEVGAFVDNIGDKKVLNSAYVFGVAAGTVATYGPRRTWGIFANARF